MTTKIQYKIDNTIKYALQAFNDYKNKNTENTLNNCRKASEAICRAFILKRYGDSNGDKIILGEIKKNLDPNTSTYSDGSFKVPLLDSLLKMCESDFDKALYYRFQDIRFGGNNASHDPISIKNEVIPEDVELCIAQFKEVLNWFWLIFLNIPIPLIIEDAKQNKIDESFLSKYDNTEWEKLYNNCNCFSKEQKYILIAPPSFNDITENQLSILSRIHWSFIIDFDPNSKENGLFYALHNEIVNQQIHPITIEQKGQKDNLVSNSFFALNWFFANGLISIPSTVSNNERNWRNMQYANFTARIIREYLNLKSEYFTLVFLWDNISFVRTIIQSFDDNISNQDYVKYIILYKDENNLSRLVEFEQYNAILIKLSISETIEGIRRTILPQNITTKSVIQVPARSNETDSIFIDISTKYFAFLERSIEVIHQGITNSNDLKHEVNSFYKGNLISWHDLALEFDVRRNKKDNLIEKVKSFLERSKGGYSIELHHRPGAGGTTLSRRIAFEFHQKYPTILISKYIKDKSNQALFELAELTQKPILAIIEAYQVTQNELNALIRKVNEDKKHVVFLYVIRTYRSDVREQHNSIFLSEKTIDLIERDRFIHRYTEIASIKSKEILKKLSERNPAQCEVIDFALTAYETDFSSLKLDEYITNYLEKLPANQYKFVCFGALLYYYTQKPISENWFCRLFYNNSLSDELSLKPFDERYISKLFIQEFDFNTLENTDLWRPRFNRFAFEIIRNALHKENWKDYLSNWAIDFLQECKNSNQFLTDDIKVAIKSLFLLNRDNEDLLGTDENYENSIAGDKKFSQIIRHIAHKEQQILIFKALVKNYPDEAHFRGHLGRFLYENAVEPIEFEEAQDEIFHAIELGDSDYNLWHIKGMCNRRRIEFIIRQDLSNLPNEEVSDLEEIIIELAELACEDFEKSRLINPYNLHSHTAQIQLLIKVISFGQIISGQTKESFIANENKIWYKNKINDVDTLINEAQYIIDLSKDLEQSKILSKSRNMINGCEGKVFNLLGDFTQAIDRFKQLSESADRTIRPYFRKMYVYSTLASKVGNQPHKFKQAWNKLSDYEFENLKKALENNIREQPENSNHIKLWLQAVRFTHRYLSIEECISTVKLWFDNSATFEISHLEASYYLYILYACKAISEGDGYIETDVSYAKTYLKLNEDKKPNDRFSFEWYGRGKGIKRLINHSQLGSMSSSEGFFEDVSLLEPVEGSISRIDDRMKGYIKLDNCGLIAFFVPFNGKFEKGVDETERVKFYIGFRYNGLVAWNVQRLNEPEQIKYNKTEVDIEGFETVEEIVAELPTDELNVEQTLQNNSVLFNDTPQLAGVKIIGKIDLAAFDKYKKKK